MTERQAIGLVATFINWINSEALLLYDLQRIMDHGGLGRILKRKRVGKTYRLTTTRGEYIIVYHGYPKDYYKDQQNPQQLKDFLTKLYGPIQPILLPDYQGKLLDLAGSLVHQRKKYYSIWRQLKSRPDAAIPKTY